MIKNKFQTLCQNFTKDQNLVGTLWEEIEEKHSEPARYYHTLKHLEQIYAELPKLDAVTEFAIFYHDIVYDVESCNNEEESAKLCELRLGSLGVAKKIVAEVVKLIHETQTHKPSCKRNALFLDADLAILGSSVKVYNEYTQNVRKEYAVYSEDIYNEGRKRVLKHFLQKERIYESEYFYEQYEEMARKNLKWELSK